MKYQLRPTSRFQKDLKLAQKRGYNISLLTEVIEKLAHGFGRYGFFGAWHES